MKTRIQIHSRSVWTFAPAFFFRRSFVRFCYWTESSQRSAFKFNELYFFPHAWHTISIVYGYLERKFYQFSLYLMCVRTSCEFSQPNVLTFFFFVCLHFRLFTLAHFDSKNFPCSVRLQLVAQMYWFSWMHTLLTQLYDWIRIYLLRRNKEEDGDDEQILIGDLTMPMM